MIAVTRHLLVGAHAMAAASVVGAAAPVAAASVHGAPRPAAAASAPSWSVTGAMMDARAYHTATTLIGPQCAAASPPPWCGDVLLVGGRQEGTILSSAELYDPWTRQTRWTQWLATQRFDHAATLLADGRVLVTGGYGGANGITLDSAEQYDPATGAWTTVAPMSTSRMGHTATLLWAAQCDAASHPTWCGRVLVAGGTGGAALEPVTPVSIFQGFDVGKPAASAELYDPVTRRWTVTGSMSAPRAFHAATALADGRVLVVGGEAGNAALPIAEIYDPASGTWASAGVMAQPRILPTATRLDAPSCTGGAAPSWCGRVLVAGGETAGVEADDYSSVGLASAEIYDPTAGTWTPTAPMSQPRVFHTATLRRDGTVLVTGGGAADATATELFDPSTSVVDGVMGTWSSAGSMARGRVKHAAALLWWPACLGQHPALTCGQVLVSGGVQPPEITITTLNSTETTSAPPTAHRVHGHRSAACRRCR